MKYEVTKDLETGNAMIDGEHRELFAAANAMMEACSQGHGRDSVERTAKFLLDYVARHFAHEEALHKKSGFPNFEAHKQFHDGYTQKLHTIVASFPVSGPTVADVSNINTHIGVLIAHIRSVDKKLGAFLNE